MNCWDNQGQYRHWYPWDLINPFCHNDAWAFWSRFKRMEKQNPLFPQPTLFNGRFNATPSSLLLWRPFQGSGHWKQSLRLIHPCQCTPTDLIEQTLTYTSRCYCWVVKRWWKWLLVDGVFWYSRGKAHDWWGQFPTTLL